MKYKTRCWCWTPARPAAPYIKTVQYDLWKRGQGDVCVLIYSSHLVYEWTTTGLQRPAHILRNRPTTGCLPVKMCSQCTLYSTVDHELVLLSGMSENMERKDSLGIIQTLVFDNCSCIFHVASFRSSTAVDDRFATLIFLSPYHRHPRVCYWGSLGLCVTWWQHCRLLNCRVCSTNRNAKDGRKQQGN